MSAEIASARPDDREWVVKLFTANASVLGNVATSVWWRYWQANNPRERWVVIRPLAFAHYLVRQDGWRSLYEIAVAEAARGQGLGRRLVEHIGAPLRLKTDAGDPRSNGFYQSLGFVCEGALTGKHGTKQLNVYARYEHFSTDADHEDRRRDGM